MCAYHTVRIVWWLVLFFFFVLAHCFYLVIFTVLVSLFFLHRKTLQTRAGVREKNTTFMSNKHRFFTVTWIWHVASEWFDELSASISMHCEYATSKAAKQLTSGRTKQKKWDGEKHPTSNAKRINSNVEKFYAHAIMEMVNCEKQLVWKIEALCYAVLYCIVLCQVIVLLKICVKFSYF